MVPEMEKKPERPLMGQVAKGKMIVGSVESRVVRDAGGNGCMTSTSKANDVVDKKSVLAPEAENPEINVTDGVNPGEGVDGDATEDPSGSSSSFDDTFSGVGGALGLSDDEINSEFCGGSQRSWAFLGYEEAFRMRKKKLTSHWRNFIRPVMWRCKWAELQMKKFQHQAAMYSKILAEYDKERQSQLENFSPESQCSRSLPFPHQMKRKKIMQRKKRNRVEDTTDVASYMQQHNLFAHFENKGTSTDNAQLVNGFVNLAGPAVRNGDIILADNDYLLQFGNEETSLERILAKIDSMQSLVHNMTTRVDKVINENPGKFSSLNKLSLLAPCDSDTSTAQDPTTPSSDKEKIRVTSPSMTTTQPASEIRVEEPILPTSPVAVAAEQVGDRLPDNAESADPPVAANKTDNAEDEIPLRKRPIKDDLIVYRRGMLSAKKHRTLSETQTSTSSNTQTQNEKSGVFLASRLSSLLNNQKKRGKRTRARSGRKLSKSLNPAFRS